MLLAGEQWRALGFRSILWELLRFYLSLRTARQQQEWLRNLRASLLFGPKENDLRIPAEIVRQLDEYLVFRDVAFEEQFRLLRDEVEAIAYCDEHSITFGTTSTQNSGHHQASKALVATVSAIAAAECSTRGLTVNSNPQQRCVWFNDHGLHVSARNLDGAIPTTTNPKIVWEIKEYWGKTSGGSKMSDAVYECNLVGRELREFEQQTGASVVHAVFIDGRDQWAARKSDFKRFIDLTMQGLIDVLIVGRAVEVHWTEILSEVLDPDS